jgi:hypothetical protein
MRGRWETTRTEALILAPRVAAFGVLVIALIAVARARGDTSDDQPAT